MFFPLDVLDPPTTTAFRSWRAHPLLYPLLAGAAGGAQRLHVPPEDRAAWSERLTSMERELAERRDGYNEAVLAHLTLLLVSVSRLATYLALRGNFSRLSRVEKALLNGGPWRHRRKARAVLSLWY